MIAPGAHIGGIPIEETVASFGPGLLIALSAAAARLRAHLRAPKAPRFCAQIVVSGKERPRG